MGDIISIKDSLVITVFSMIVVFTVLIIISFLISALKSVGGEKKVEPVKQVAKQEPIKANENLQVADTKVNDEELVAVIAAAIAASLGVSIPEINIKSIRRVEQRTPAWSSAGRQEQIFNKL